MNLLVKTSSSKNDFVFLKIHSNEGYSDSRKILVHGLGNIVISVKSLYLIIGSINLEDRFRQSGFRQSGIGIYSLVSKESLNRLQKDSSYESGY